jgi:hypothetical protein
MPAPRTHQKWPSAHLAYLLGDKDQLAYAQIELLFLSFLSDTGQEYTIQRLVEIQKELRQPERSH